MLPEGRLIVNGRMLETVEDGWRGRFKAFGLRAEVRLRDATPATAREALRLVSEECWRVQAAFSLHGAESLVRAANAGAGGWVPTGREFDRLLDFADTCFRLSRGRFDISRPIAQRAEAGVPDAGGWSRIERKRGRLRLPPGLSIDFGAMAREYALDRALFIARQVHAGDLLLRVGAEAAVEAESVPWRLATASPDESGPDAIELLSGAIATRSAVSRTDSDAADVEPDGSAPRAITVVAPQCIQAGMLATLALLNGANAERFLGEQGVRFWCQREGVVTP